MNEYLFCDGGTDIYSYPIMVITNSYLNVIIILSKSHHNLNHSENIFSIRYPNTTVLYMIGFLN